MGKCRHARPWVRQALPTLADFRLGRTVIQKAFLRIADDSANSARAVHCSQCLWQEQISFRFLSSSFHSLRFLSLFWHNLQILLLTLSPPILCVRTPAEAGWHLVAVGQPRVTQAQAFETTRVVSLLPCREKKSF